MIDEAFTQHRLWRETQDAAAYRAWAESFKLKIAQTLQQWSAKPGYAADILLRCLRVKAEQLWYFQGPPEVPPDNNQAERSLRLAVTKRKVCGGESALREGFPPQATANPKGSRSMSRFAQTADSQSCDSNLSCPRPLSHQVFPASLAVSTLCCDVPAFSHSSDLNLYS